jgi:hypothetical protein
MWPSEFVDKVSPILFPDLQKPKEHYVSYVKTVLRPKWTSDLASASSLLDFRDYAEDTLTTLISNYSCEMISLDLTIDKLVKAVKRTEESASRRSLTVAFIEENAYCLKNAINRLPTTFIKYCIDRELEVFFSHAKGIGRFRPLLKAPREAIETVVKDMESSPFTLDNVQKFAKDLGLLTLWPILAIWSSNQTGELEDLFIHPPMPRIFGAPSCVKNDIDSSIKPDQVAKKARKPLSMQNVVLSGNGHLAWKPSESAEWITEACDRAYLVAALPGLASRYVWTLKPETLEASIVCLQPFKAVAHFELTPDEVSGTPNWIDCQRDSEGSLVLLWGTINSLTGSLFTQNIMAFDEECLIESKPLEMLERISLLPDRRTVGVRVDWRDHGNLLSVHHTVTDCLKDSERAWNHTYQIVFGQNLLMTLKSDSRPIEAVYGCPHDVFLLSPLSSKNAIQHWALDDTYKMKETMEIPKCPAGHWTSFCVSF